MAGVLRVLVGLVASVATFAAWGLFIVAIMGATLYICRFIPMTGRRKRR
jgi:uncharacterized membrane protein